jgi:hypothetical protein
MPDLKDIIAGRTKKKFVKKEYRPWDLGGNSTRDLKVVGASSELNAEKEKGALVTPKIQSAYIDNSHIARKVNTIKDSIRTQKDSIKDSIRTQKDSIEESVKDSNRTQKDSIKDSNKDSTIELGIEPSSTYKKSNSNENLSIDDIKTTLKRLGGNEKRMFFYIINICSINGSSSTGEMLALDFDTQLNIIRSSRESALSRLVNKGILIRGQGKRGRHSTLLFYVPEIVIKEAINLLTLNQQWSVQNSTSIGLDKASNIGPYSSSSNINTITTNSFPEDWEKINFDLLGDIGFSFTQLKQIYRLDITTSEVVQESINHFSFGLKNNPKLKKYSDPLNVIMGVLRKGESWFEKDYCSPQEIAQRKIMEQKKAEKERLKKLEEEAYEFALTEWKDELSTKEIEQIDNEKKGKGSVIPQKVKLSMYFREHIWPEKKVEYFI